MKNILPVPPVTPRRLRLNTVQWLGIPLMMLVPVLALWGVFGRQHSAVRAASPELDLTIRYISCLRYKQSHQMAVTVTNVSGRPLYNLTVACDSAWGSSYENLTFIPEPLQPYIVRKDSLAPGEQFLVHLEGQQVAGSHTGLITTQAQGTEAVRVYIRTFVFP